MEWVGRDERGDVDLPCRPMLRGWGDVPNWRGARAPVGGVDGEEHEVREEEE